DLVDMVPSGHIKISGCPNGCGQHHIGSIGFQGSVRKLGNRAVPQYFVLVGGGASDEGVAHFGKVVSKVPVHGLTDALDRLLGLYKAKREGEEELGAFFRRIPPAMATDVLKDLAQLLPNETTDEDFVDLGESQAFNPEVMDGECSASRTCRSRLFVLTSRLFRFGAAISGGPFFVRSSRRTLSRARSLVSKR